MFDFLFGWRKASRCKELIRSVRSRLKLLRKKRDAIVRHLRDDISQLLQCGYHRNAFFRVEQLFKDQSILVAYDLLDHFCEFIIINLPYIRRHRDCPNDINEAVSSLIFAAARCADLPELQTLRRLFGERYGNDFEVAAVESFPGSLVNRQIRESLCSRSISDDLKLKLMEEIAREHNINLVHPEIGNGGSLQTQKVYNPAIKGSNCEQGKEVLEKDIQIVYSDTKRAKMQVFHVKEMLPPYGIDLPRKNGYLKRDTGPADRLSNCEDVEAISCLSCANSEDNSNSTGAVMDRHNSPQICQLLNSPKIHNIEPDGEKLKNFDPPHASRVVSSASQQQNVETKADHKGSSTELLESFIVYIDGLDDFHHDMKESNRDKDERWVESNECQRPQESKHVSSGKPLQSKVENGAGLCGGERQGNGYGNCCRTISRADEEILSDAAKRSDLLKEYTMSRGLPDEKSDSGKSSRRKKSVGMKDAGCQLYYDDACDCSGINSPSFLGEEDKLADILLSHGCCHCSVTESNNELCMGRENHANGRMLIKKKIRRGSSGEGSRSGLSKGVHGRKCPSPQKSFYGAQEISAEEIENNCISHRCKYNRRSYGSCPLDHYTISDCCLEHPCYFLARNDDKEVWGSTCKATGAAEEAGLRSSVFQQGQQENEGMPYHCTCAATLCHKSFSSSAMSKATNEQELTHTNSDKEHQGSVAARKDYQGCTRAACAAVIGSKNYGSKVLMKKDGMSDSCAGRTCSQTSSSEILQPTPRPPYLRAMTMPSERPKSSSTDLTLRSASFQFPKHNWLSGHVHPKLPDYDDLKAKFTSLKNEYLQRTTA